MRKLIIVLLLVVSCKSETKKEVNKNQPENIIDQNDYLIVTINAMVLEDDVFEVYYHSKKDKTFKSKNFVTAIVKGKKEPQNIVFSIPKNIYPERLRLDFGKNRNQKLIELNEVKLGYNMKEYIFSEFELKNELKPSKFIQFNKDKLLIQTKQIDEKYDPYFYTMKVSNIIDYLLED